MTTRAALVPRTVTAPLELPLVEALPMPLELALALPFLAAALAALGGYLGVRGAARAQLRRLRDLEDDVAQLDRRLSRREGQAGREVREQREQATSDEIRAHLAAHGTGPLRAPAAPAAPRSRAEILALARRQGANGGEEE